MRSFFTMLRNRLASTKQADAARQTTHPEELQVIVPGAVVLPLPKLPRDEISVPASINGRDLSTGRL